MKTNLGSKLIIIHNELISRLKIPNRIEDKNAWSHLPRLWPGSAAKANKTRDRTGNR